MNYEQIARINCNTVKILLHKVFYGRNKQHVCSLMYHHSGSLFSQIYLLIYTSMSVRKNSSHMGNQTKGAYVKVHLVP
jgi:hypothetical protein